MDVNKDLKGLEDVQKNMTEALMGQDSETSVKSEFPLWDEVKKMNDSLKS